MTTETCKTPLLLFEELEWIDANQKRCFACGHLEIFHNTHCCDFCKVPMCECKWWVMSDEDKTEQ